MSNTAKWHLFVMLSSPGAVRRAGGLTSEDCESWRAVTGLDVRVRAPVAAVECHPHEPTGASRRTCMPRGKKNSPFSAAAGARG